MKRMTAAQYKATASEDGGQEIVVDYLELRFNCRVFHIPNEGKRSFAERKRQKKIGLRAGAPDLLVLFPDAITILIEMKRLDGGVIPDDQRNLQHWCYGSGHHYGICRTIEDVDALLRRAGVL